ncbi:MAG: exonuclease SbcCD subunit D [Candidatus Nanohaloarchaea archaeon]
MDISIISDTHFGYKWGEERGEDPFENAREAFEESLDADLILLPGDIFDRKIPKQEVLDRAAEILSIPMEGDRTVETDAELGMHGSGIPVVAIHGTHERRPSSYTNPIELMAQTGHLYHLHNDNIVFEKDDKKVAVHGMSGVPEQYAPKVLEKFAPEPVEDAFNILVLHQSIEGFVYTGEGDYLTLEQLPEGFDLIVDGHIHWYNIDRFGEGKPLVFPGSTVTTQMRKIEAEKDKGFLRLDTTEGELEFVPLDRPRDVHYVEIEADGESWAAIKERARQELEGISGDRKPLVNLKITGEASGRVNPRELKQMFRDRMFLNVNSSIQRETGGGESIDEEVEAMEKGREILQEKVDDVGIDEEELFQLLEDGNSSEALKHLKKAEFDGDDTGS